jgi:hypothetical protein
LVVSVILSRKLPDTAAVLQVLSLHGGK